MVRADGWFYAIHPDDLWVAQETANIFGGSVEVSTDDGQTWEAK